MAKNKSKSKSSATSASQGSGLNKLLLVLGLLTALLSSVVYFVEQNLNQFYIFDLDHLDDLSKRAIAKHGEDTRSVVQYIVTELNEKVPEHINLKEEWVFNNAGGAMGAMYIIHASVTEYLIIFGMFVCCNCISIANILSNRHCHWY
jgi:C-8 sterol isomerase